MIEVELPDGSVAEFPDDIPQDQIQAVIARQFQQPPELLRRPEPAPIDLDAIRKQEFQRLQQEQTEELGPVGRFLAGAGQSLYQTGRGISQLFGGMSPEEVAETRRLDEALMGTTGGFSGNVVGNIAQILGPGLALRAASAPAAVQSAFLPQTYAASAAQGAALGAVQPVAEGESRALNAALGAGVGLGGQFLPRAIGATARGAGAVLSPMTAGGQERIAASAIQRFATNPALSVEQSAVPGVTRSLAEATADPGIAQLERAASVASPETAAALDALRRSNNAARVEALEGIAGTVEEMAKAERGRDKGALGLLGKAMASTKGVDLSRVEGLAKNILASRSGQRSVVSGAVNDVLSKIDAAKANVAREFAKTANLPVEQVKGVKLNASTMYGIRQHIDDLMSGRVGGDAKSAVAARRELQAIKSALDQAISKAAPEFSQYLKAYQAGSIPINQMQLGREILERATGNVRDPITGALKITPAKMGRAVENLDQTAAAATGFKRAKAANILTDQQMGVLRSINQDLGRESFAESAARVPGSPTAQYLVGQNILGQVMRPLGVPGSASEVLERAVATPLERIYQLTGASQKVQQALGRMLANPAEAQRVMQSLPPADRKMVERVIAQYSAPALSGGTQK